MRFLQQGDVLFHETKFPKRKLENIESGVVQEGEHTGHAHRLRFRHDEMPEGAPNWKLFQDPKTGKRYLKVSDSPADLSHEEHKTISIPPGEYEIGIIQEYDHFTEEARNVQD